MRLGKHLAHAGVASRRASEALVVDGRVTVDGAVVTDPARGVTGEEAIAVDGELVRGPGTRVVYALHKPAGVVSTAADTHGRPDRRRSRAHRASACTPSGAWTPTARA